MGELGLGELGGSAVLSAVGWKVVIGVGGAQLATRLPAATIVASPVSQPLCVMSQVLRNP